MSDVDYETHEIDLRLEPSPMQTRNKVVVAVVLAVVALVSIFILGNIFSAPETYANLISTLDEKKGNVMGLMGTTTAASAAISLLPGDAGSAIAEQLVDLSSYFLVILAVIYLEKFLVTTFGYLAFTFLIPIACVMFGVALFAQPGSLLKQNLQKIGAKLAALGVALALVVPASVWLSNNVDQSFSESLAASNAATQEATQQLEESTQAGEEEAEDQGIFSNIVGAVQSGVDEITGSAKEALDTMGQQLNNMVDTIAIMVVTSCLIPLIVLAIFLWLAKVITGLDFGTTSQVMGSARLKGRSFAGSLKR